MEIKEDTGQRCLATNVYVTGSEPEQTQYARGHCCCWKMLGEIRDIRISIWDAKEMAQLVNCLL